MSKIAIHSPQEAVPIDRGRMREIARAVLEGEGIGDYEISLAFVDNTTIHRLNKQYLDHDEPTDVLTFPYSAANARKLEGELVLGVEVAQAQATERGHDVGAELALYVIHGLLHLCGFDDKSPADEKAMRERERHYLKSSGCLISSFSVRRAARTLNEETDHIMSLETASAIIIRGTDFSETSKVVTLWTKEFGKVRALAKGGRRLKSNFDVALDLLTVCGIVLLRKSSGSLDLLTEARVEERFPQLRLDLAALNGAYYVAEMLGDWTQDYDPHPCLFDEALVTLRNLGQPGVLTGPCLAHFELVLLRELGYGPALNFCADCGEGLLGTGLAFSAAGGGVLCAGCQPRQREKRPLTEGAWQALEQLQSAGDAWRNIHDPLVRGEVRQLLNHYVTYLLGRQPRLLPYLGS